MKKLPLFLLVLFLFYGQWASPSQIPDLKTVRIITTHVADPVYMLEATVDVAGNIGVSAGPDGILLIDTQFAPLADRIKGALQSITDGKIRYIVNTHHHEDPSFGNRVWGQKALIISHSKRKRVLI